MRSTQIMGLNSRAEHFLEKNVQTKFEYCVCPNCKEPHIETQIIHPHIDRSDLGLFLDGPKLYKYLLKDDTWIYEYIQSEVWSSGPCIFISLSRDPEGNDPIFESMWMEKEMEM